MKSEKTHNHLATHLGVAALLSAFFSAPSAWAQIDVGVDTEGSADVGGESAEPEAPVDQPTAVEFEASGNVSLDEEAAASEEEEPQLSPEDETDDDLDSPDEEASETGDAVPMEKAPEDSPEFKRKTLWQALDNDSNRFGFDGGFQLDVSYADYRFSAESFPKETLNDVRGQFWLTPVLEHRFGKNKEAFIRSKAEFVAWIREQIQEYQVNLFDAFAAVGVDDVADLSVGRVTTQRVYYPGNGFDIFTVEDEGTLREPNREARNFFAFRYDFDHLWLRETPGRAVLKVYPLRKVLPDDWNDLTVEGTVEYGKVRVSNILGGRGSAIYDQQWFRLAAGIEWQESRRSWGEFDAPGELCDDCYWTYKNGTGLMAVVRPPYMELGLSSNDSNEVNKGPNGALGAAGVTDRRTQGGFVELHTGHLLASTKNGPRAAWHADQRSEDIRQITVGYGMKRTELVVGNGDFQQHDQHALYAKYNLGFNQSYLKLVGSAAEGKDYNLISAEGAEEVYRFSQADMLAIRLRFAYFW